MKLVALADRVVLKQLEAETKTKTGIILTSSAQEKPQEASSCCRSWNRRCEDGSERWTESNLF